MLDLLWQSSLFLVNIGCVKDSVRPSRIQAGQRPAGDDRHARPDRGDVVDGRQVRLLRHVLRRPRGEALDKQLVLAGFTRRLAQSATGEVTFRRHSPASS